jgi:hypothetical protein
MKIGVISDTHNFFDPRISRLFAGVEHILHAGDIGLPRIILDLEQIAPVTAVSGNTDDPGLHYRPTECVELAGPSLFAKRSAGFCTSTPDMPVTRVLAWSGPWPSCIATSKASGPSIRSFELPPVRFPPRRLLYGE